MNVQELIARNSTRMNALYNNIDQTERYEQIAANYRSNFKSEPELFVSAPGRIEVVGNHTDHNHGKVLAASVNLDTVGAIAATGNDIVTVYSDGFDGCFSVDLNDLTVHEDEKETTFALIRGVAARLKELGYMIGGFNAQVNSTVFRGSGLSSSAAFEVMLVAAFDVLFNNWSIDPKLNARISQYAENVYFGKPCGVMDQTASAVGGLVSLDFEPEIANVEATAFDFTARGYSVCVVRAGGEHGNLSYAYASIPSEMKQVAQAFGKEFLVDVSPEELMANLKMLKGKVSDRAILRAFHFADETARVVDAVEALKAGDTMKFFDVLIASGNSSWKLLQNLHVEGSDNQEIPLALEMSHRLLDGKGAWRLNGGGFAGTILAFVPTDMADTYANAMDAVFGENATNVLSVRPEGVIYLR